MAGAVGNQSDTECRWPRRCHRYKFVAVSRISSQASRALGFVCEMERSNYIIPSAVFLGSLAYASVIVHRQRHLQRSPFLFNPAYPKPAYPRRVSKDSIFGDQVDLMRPASVQLSRLDRRYRDVGA